MSTGRHVPFRSFDPYDEARIARRRLPHWRQPGVSYFVTFRLADSLPQSLLRHWRHERAIWLRLHAQPWGVKEQREYEARFIGRMQEWLDAGMVLATCGGLLCAWNSNVVCCDSMGTVMTLTRLF